MIKSEWLDHVTLMTGVMIAENSAISKKKNNILKYIKIENSYNISQY